MCSNFTFLLSHLYNDGCGWALMNIKTTLINAQYEPLTFISFIVQARAILKQVDKIKVASKKHEKMVINFKESGSSYM